MICTCMWEIPIILNLVGNSSASTFSKWQSFGSLDLDYIHYGSYGSEDASLTIGSLFTDSKNSPHLRISFEDDSLIAGGKVKFSVTCYFAKQFNALRKKCCPGEVDFVRSLSRCKRWSAQGGKSNVYFAKSLDERFIIKQVQKTELESFEEFAPQYFKYLTDSLSSGSPTCLAKVLGIYQVTVKHLKGGKETKMDLIVMENLFFKRSISRVYDLKGSSRARYNEDTTGTNKVLLDMNLIETLRAKPIFLGSKAKRSLERAVWNDTSFLASVDRLLPRRQASQEQMMMPMKQAIDQQMMVPEKQTVSKKIMMAPLTKQTVNRRNRASSFALVSLVSVGLVGMKNKGDTTRTMPHPETTLSCIQTRRVPSSGKQTLEHRELMETVFPGASATGKHHWTPGEKVAEPTNVSSYSADSLGAQPFVDPIPSCAQDVDFDFSLEPMPTVNNNRKRTPPTSCGKSKTATSGASIIAKNMNDLTNVVCTQNQQVTVKHHIGNKSLYTISECMHRLRNILSLLGMPLFHFPSTLMDNADYREVMMCQLDDDHIIGWLTQKQLQCSSGAPFANLFGAR
ncbi:hypothetical protein TEA_007705 [Camellia sinensis var. sinensis]|uniref:PIPK domain-containing protein n=1 Tax=Camellia sinensis var. sinensis TaxID=542762 RepID=A0A4S4D8B2_CAMSN|nr:hypothetical protein TEA_007705 [Camellia sinensis var. sinensis]